MLQKGEIILQKRTVYLVHVVDKICTGPNIDRKRDKRAVQKLGTDQNVSAEFL